MQKKIDSWNETGGVIYRPRHKISTNCRSFYRLFSHIIQQYRKQSVQVFALNQKSITSFHQYLDINMFLSYLDLKMETLYKKIFV